MLEMLWNVSKISETAKSYRVVSFDIFDTLIKRDAGTPTAIFAYVQEAYNARHPDAKINDFKEKRIEAERKARESRRPAEVTIAEIYAAGDIPDADELMKLEEETEIRCCVPNKDVVEQFRQCQKNGQRIVLTSDMYLPTDVIERMLQKCGVSGYEKLYLSSEVGVKKNTGELYSLLMADLGLQGKDILHIGDSITADNLVPRKLGMGSFYISRYLHNTEFLKKRDVINADTPLFPFLNNRLPFYRDRTQAYQWGYETFGPLLLGFCQWVYEHAKAKGFKHVYFLARDMNLVHQIYGKYYSSEGVTYLEVSRKSLRKTYVRKTGKLLSILDTLTRHSYALEYLLTALELPDEEIQKIGAKYDLSQKIDLHTPSPAWIAELDADVTRLLSDGGDNAEEYLKENGLFDGKPAAIVDIGWHGTIQNMLEVITGRSFDGLYFGSAKRDYFRDMNMEGYWFLYHKEKDSYQHISIISILETMLFAQIGTTLGYQKEGVHYVPIYNQAEMSDFSFVGEFQRGGMGFVEDYLETYGTDSAIKSAEVALPFTYMAFFPELRQVGLLGNLPYEEGKIYHLVQKRNRRDYLFHPGAVIRDYDNSRWKTGYIKWLFPFVTKPNAIETLVRNRRKLMRRL